MRLPLFQANSLHAKPEKNKMKEILKDNDFTIKGKIEVTDCNLYYGDFHALKNINIEMEQNKVTAFIGPSGCGKL